MIIVDAYNVLHLPDAGAPGGDLDLARLCALIGKSRYARERVLVVCDGRPHPALGLAARPGGAAKGRVAGIEALFSGDARSADDEIEDRLRLGAGSGVTVVSDDRRLRRAASRAGARSLGSSAFLAHLLVDASGRAGPQLPNFARDIPLDPYSIAHWMGEFGLDAPSPVGMARTASTRTRPAPQRRPRDPARESAAARDGADEASDTARGDRSSPSSGLPDERLSSTGSLADDPVLREALDAWKGRLSLEDLDMRRWLEHRPPPGGPRP